MVKLEMIKDNNGHDHLMYVIDHAEIFRMMELGKFGPGVCDGCNESILENGEPNMYLNPELRDSYCHECSSKYFKRMKHYKEDIKYLSEFVKNIPEYYEFNLTEEDKNVVDSYVKYLNKLEEILPETEQGE